MPSITVRNDSSHDQTFEVHGFLNNPPTITVKHNGGTAKVHSPDHQKVSGAIIAVHDGHEGEQAEVTFNGSPNGQNQYCEFSNIS